MEQEEITIRSCKQCDEPLIRKEKERAYKFKNREFCDRKCASLFTRLNKTPVALPEHPPCVICGEAIERGSESLPAWLSRIRHKDCKPPIRNCEVCGEVIEQGPCESTIRFSRRRIHSKCGGETLKYGRPHKPASPPPKYTGPGRKPKKKAEKAPPKKPGWMQPTLTEIKVEAAEIEVKHEPAESSPEPAKDEAVEAPKAAEPIAVLTYQNGLRPGRKKKAPTPTEAQLASEREQIERFLAERGVTKCPTAFVAATSTTKMTPEEADMKIREMKIADPVTAVEMKRRIQVANARSADRAKKIRQMQSLQRDGD
jgi:hypothetical protein